MYVLIIELFRNIFNDLISVEEDGMTYPGVNFLKELKKKKTLCVLKIFV